MSSDGWGCLSCLVVSDDKYTFLSVDEFGRDDEFVSDSGLAGEVCGTSNVVGEVMTVWLLLSLVSLENCTERTGTGLEIVVILHSE